MLSGCQEVVFLDLISNKNTELGLLRRRSEKTTSQWTLSYCTRMKEYFLCEFRRPEPLNSDEWFEFMSANCETCSIEKVKVYDITSKQMELPLIQIHDLWFKFCKFTMYDNTKYQHGFLIDEKMEAHGALITGDLLSFRFMKSSVTKTPLLS
jgi:hypothetical protein